MKKLSDHLNQIADKRVIVRCNFDVPIEGGKVLDTTRIEDSIETIKTLRKVGAKVILIAHYSRPENGYDESKSLLPIIPVLEELVGEKVAFSPYKENLSDVTIDSNESIVLLDNLRFWEQETSNDDAFAKQLSLMGDVYVNQAFANCHRKHASMVGLPKHLPAYAGINLAKEVDILSKLRNNPDKPLVVIIGGAKLETKEPLVSVFADVADHILVGGKVALDIVEKGIDLPSNVIIGEMVETGKDITRETAVRFAEIISEASSVIWNGTMGVFEEKEHQEGTRIVADAVNTTKAFTLVGGGDTETALTELDAEEGLDFISSGGGAMLTYLSEGKLVALELLN